MIGTGIDSLDILSDCFARMPGIGRKSAQRLALSLLSDTPQEVEAFTEAIRNAREKIHRCPVCQNLTDRELCPVCDDPTRDHGVICVVEDPRAVMAFERVRSYRGLYHVLHGVISPMSGKTPDSICLRELLTRVSQGEVREVIVATGATTEGEATAMYIAKLLRAFEHLKVSRLAHGIPYGGELEYADEITLARALEGRRDC